MAQFSFSTYSDLVNRAQNGGSKAASPKIGYFKLGDGESALVRINIHDVSDIAFATVHKPQFGKKFEGLSNPYAGISCLNEVGSYSDNCPLCKAVAENHPVIGKAEKKCFIPMLVAYQDKTSGAWSEPVPVVWERPAGYARELATKIQNYGDLTKNLFKMTRIGSGKETRYTLDFAVPTIFKPETIPEDFSAFDNFKVNKHSYWELTKEEIEDYLTTGEFHIGAQSAEIKDDALPESLTTAKPAAQTTVQAAAKPATQAAQTTTTKEEAPKKYNQFSW